MFWLRYNVSQLLDHSSLFVELLLQKNTYYLSSKLYSLLKNVDFGTESMEFSVFT